MNRKQFKDLAATKSPQLIIACQVPVVDVVVAVRATCSFAEFPFAFSTFSLFLTTFFFWQKYFCFSNIFSLTELLLSSAHGRERLPIVVADL